ncbi:MAG: hypothetical protein HIU93_11535 [Acidobacteria bacterium]|nr:hypothetical protein [Acidobacteriota bacterium]
MSSIARAQQASAVQYQKALEARYPQLSPSAALDAVSQPLVLTRAAMSNWSDAELQALVVAIGEARLECATRSPEMFHNSDLIALGRLCALGQQWSTVANAAALYINAPASGTDDQKPELATAYALAVDASLQVRDPATALAQAKAMLAAVPYSSTVDATTNEALHYMQLAFMDQALDLYAVREPHVLAALRAKPPAATANATANATPNATATTTPTSTPTSTDVPVAALYGDGVAYAALEQLACQPSAAAATVADLNQALVAATQTPDDQVKIAEARSQYGMLGQPLPPIAPTLSLYDVTETPRINTEYGASTVLLLFPPWCAQCVRMAQGLLSTLGRVSEQNVHIYGLLAEPTPTVVVPAPPDQRRSGKSHPAAVPAKNQATDETPPTIEERLRHTPTLVVPEATVRTFYAEGFPFLIATDSKGIVRFMQPAPENALAEGSFVDQVTAQIVRQWPPAAAKAVVGNTSSKP